MTRAKANDYPSNVQEEIEAATISATEIPQQYKLGYIAYYGREDPPAWVGIAWRAGWLAAEMDVVFGEYDDHDEGWPWDHSRPLKGQYEEYVARGRALTSLVRQTEDAGGYDEKKTCRLLSHGFCSCNECAFP